MNVNGLFPIPLGSAQLDREITQQEKDYILSLELSKNMGNYRSINTHVLLNPQMSGIREFISNSLGLFFTEIYQPLTTDIRVTQSWVNISNPGEYHHKHFHPNSFISGVFYIQANSDDKIHFYNEQQNTLIIPHKSYNLFNSETWWVDVKEGQLLLFPSKLQHMVSNVQAAENKQRISLSFNTFLVGTLGTEDTLTQLIL